MTTKETASIKRQTQELMIKQLGIKPTLKSITLLETSSFGMFAESIAWAVNGKGYTWSLYNGNKVERDEAYDLKN